MDYNSIFPKLWVGSCPRNAEDVRRLAQETGLSVILSLVTDDDIKRLELPWPELEEQCRRHGIGLVRMPVTDGDPEDLREKLPDCVLTLDHMLAAGHTVFLHCVAGIDRAPTVAVAYLHWCLGYQVEEAEAFVVKRRGSSPDVTAIRLASNAAKFQ